MTKGNLRKKEFIWLTGPKREEPIVTGGWEGQNSKQQPWQQNRKLSNGTFNHVGETERANRKWAMLCIPKAEHTAIRQNCTAPKYHHPLGTKNSGELAPTSSALLSPS